MASKSRRRQAARTAAAAPAAPEQARARPGRRIWIAAGAALAAIVVAVVVALVTGGGGSGSSSFSDQKAADDHAPPALKAAAEAVGFHPTTDPGTGAIESKPASAAPPPRSPLLLAAGTTAPDFSLKTPQGEAVGLRDLRGKAVLLEFFATWCGLCNTEAPHLKALAASLPSKRVAVVTINADAEDAASVYAFHRFYAEPFPALLDPSVHPGSFNEPGLPGPVTQQYGMKALPTFYVIDPHGKIAWRSDGEQPDAKLRQELTRAAAL